jgi:hypothetical protein
MAKTAAIRRHPPLHSDLEAVEEVREFVHESHALYPHGRLHLKLEFFAGPMKRAFEMQPQQVADINSLTLRELYQQNRWHELGWKSARMSAFWTVSAHRIHRHRLPYVCLLSSHHK